MSTFRKAIRLLGSAIFVVFGSHPVATGQPVIAPVVPVAHGAALRILALGDSITWGYNDPTGNSYRRDVECLLYTGGNSVELIGSVEHGDWDNNASDSFIYHTIDDILDAARPELTLDISKPNIILLHAGTVNFVLGQNVTNAPERLGVLVDFITENNPETLLVVATLIPNTNATVNGLIDSFNDQLPAVVAARARQGKRVVAVSMRHVTTDMLIDDSHPNAAGSRAMASNFYQAVLEANRRGLVVAASGPFVDRGASSVSSSGKCWV